MNGDQNCSQDRTFRRPTPPRRTTGKPEETATQRKAQSNPVLTEIDHDARRARPSPRFPSSSSPSPPLPHRILGPQGLFSTPVSLSLSVACFSRSLSASTRTSNRSRQGQGQGQGARSQEMSRQGGGRYCSAPRFFSQRFSQVRKVGGVCVG